ncbi:MAG: putative dgqhr domain [Bacillales bacterium]|jgi:DGQHR domain-containing protein|nr:putative dgqhr domain [Bacillales bacterium]
MIIPLLKIEQKKEHIYTTKIKVKDLKKYVVINFRYPYINSLSSSDQEKFSKYLNNLQKKGLNVSFSDYSIQRRLQPDKLRSISDYVKKNSNFIPNSIILGCFNKLVEEGTLDYSYESEIIPVEEDLGMYKIDINENYEMTAIDGQHRLAGLFTSNEPEIEEMELSVVLLFGVSLSTSAKIFIDINSNQKSVDKSLIYDLMPVLDFNNEKMKLNDRELESIQRCHRICVTFYNNEKSPFYRQIRMLGTGNGSISQAFLVEEIYPLIHNGVLSDFDLKRQFNVLFNYFNAIREVFSDDWPVLEGNFDNKQQESRAKDILKNKKSQLSKTLGVGAFLKVFPYLNQIVTEELESSSIKYEDKDYNINQKRLFAKHIMKLKCRIAWSKEEYEKSTKTLNQGEQEQIYYSETSRSAINKLASEIKRILV